MSLFFPHNNATAFEFIYIAQTTHNTAPAIAHSKMIYQVWECQANYGTIITGYFTRPHESGFASVFRNLMWMAKDIESNNYV